MICFKVYYLGTWTGKTDESHEELDFKLEEITN
jgi:hypothetical protein